ncbi:MAG TPA: hypothetical protein VK668_07575 [Mucilaginibacter sp.]|nr:hypothetical protein [Mucilaginibacter sp.]
MKKLALLICIVLAVTSCNNDKGKSKKDSGVKTEHKKLTTVEQTLNGIDLIHASAMVDNFQSDNTSSHMNTAVWLSKEWLDAITSLLNKEQATVKTDGIRIYFAKKPDGLSKSNTVVIVSTRDGGTDTNAESGSDHIDYFEHDLDFLATATATAKAKVVEEYSPAEGATLYDEHNTCPAKDGCAINTINYITCENAGKAVRNFGSSTINTNSEWFSIDLIKYLDLELNSAPEDVTADGIRIYFAKNTDETNTNIKYKKKRRHSFVIITTQADGSIHKDNYICYVHKGGTDNGEQCPNNCNGVKLP